MALIHHLPDGLENLGVPPKSVDAAGSDETTTTESATESAGPVLLHELGHVLGLGHTTNPAGVMYPTELGVSTCAPAEGAALRHLRSLCD